MLLFIPEDCYQDLKCEDCRNRFVVWQKEAISMLSVGVLKALFIWHDDLQSD
jgi:hypothetical protein